MNAVKRVISFILATALVLLAWELIAHKVANPKLFPTPRYVFTESINSFAQFDEIGSATGLSVLLQHTSQTLLRIIIGTTLGSLLGLAYAVAGFYWSSIRPISNVFALLFRSIPLLVLMPLFVFWFGGSPVGIYTWLTFASFTVVATGAIDAIANVDLSHIQKAQILCASRTQITSQIILPAIAPEVISAYKALMGFSWAFSLGAEFLVARSGLGYLASYAYMYANMGQLLLIMVLYGLLGLLTFAMLHVIFSRTGWLAQNPLKQ